MVSCLTGIGFIIGPGRRGQMLRILKRFYTTVFMVIIPVLLGCSGGELTAVPPVCDTVAVMSEAIGSDRDLWGIWELVPTADLTGFRVVPVRSAEVHFDVTDNVTPPACTDCLWIEVLEIKPVEKTIKIRVNLKNPTQLTGYDVRAIMVSNLEEMHLLNADAYTNLWDDGGAIEINPFLAFAETQNNREFKPGYTHSKVCDIKYSTFADLVGTMVVVDASWPSNCREPYALENFAQTGSMLPEGGIVGVKIDVKDWQDNAEDVFIDSGPVNGGVVELEYDSGYEWDGFIMIVDPMPAGEYSLLAYAGSEGTPISIYNYVIFTIIPCLPEGNESWEDANELPFGFDTGPQEVCITDPDDWYTFSVEEHLYGMISMSLLNDTGSCGVSFYDDPEAEPLLTENVTYGSDLEFNTTPMDFGPGDYYLKVSHTGTDNETREYTLYNDAKDSVCYPDGNGSYLTAIEVPLGLTSDLQYVCLDDKEDWFKITYDGDSSVVLRLDVLNATGPADMTLYDEEQAPGAEPYTDYVVADPTADIDFGPLELPAGDYYARIRHVGSDSEYREYTLKHYDSGTGWALTWGGADGDFAYDVGVNGEGDIFVVGNFNGEVDLDPGDGTDMHGVGEPGGHSYLSKFNSVGEYQWGLSWGGNPAPFYADAIAIDNSDNVYITGIFINSVDFNPGAGVDEHTPNGDRDAFLLKLDASGYFQWAKSWGGAPFSSTDTIAMSVDTDTMFGVYVSGAFDHTVDFDPGFDSEERSSNGLDKEDAFLVKFNSNGDFLWVNTWGSEYGGIDPLETAACVAVDTSGNAYVTGAFIDEVDFDPSGGEELRTPNGFEDIYLSKFDTSGDLLWVKTWGGDDDSGGDPWDKGIALGVDDSGYAYITGQFAGTVDFDPGTGEDIHTSTSAYADIFLTKFDSLGEHIWAGAYAENMQYVYDIAVNGEGTSYFTGRIRHSIYTGDLFAAKYNSNGSEAWSAFWGGNFDFKTYGVAYGANGEVYVVGDFFGGYIDFDPSMTTDTHSSNGSFDAFLIKILDDGEW